MHLIVAGPGISPGPATFLSFEGNPVEQDSTDQPMEKSPESINAGGRRGGLLKQAVEREGDCDREVRLLACPGSHRGQARAWPPGSVSKIIAAIAVNTNLISLIFHLFAVEQRFLPL